MFYRVDPERVLFRYVDGEAVLIHAETSYYYSLNAVGTFVWQLLVERGRTGAELIDAVRQQYSPAPESVTQDVESLLNELKQEGLIVEEKR